MREIYTRPVRVLIALFGGVALGAGGCATFRTDNEIGSGSLILAGSVSLVIALLGYVPPFKMGGLEVGLLRAEQAAENVAEQVEEAASRPDATLETVTQAAKDAAEEASLRSWMLYEFGRSMGGGSRVTNESDRSGRIWTVWRRNGLPYKAAFRAKDIVEWRRQARAAQDREDAVDFDPEDDPDFEPDEDVDRGR